MNNDFDEMVEWSKTNGINNHDHAGASRIRDEFDCSWSVAEEVAAVARGEETKPSVNADQDNVIELIRKNVPDGLNDVDEFINEIQSWSETLQSMEIERSLAELEIKTDKPILLVTIADIHFGNIQTDIGRLMEHMDLIRERPYVFTLLDGDLTEGGILKSMMDLVLEQVITPKNQRKVIWSLMEKICPNLLAVITGQHDDWPSKTADFEWLEWFSDEHDISYLGWGGKIELNVGEQPWDILARHRYRFNSSQNATHSPKKMMKEGPWGFGDVAIVADKHEYAYECCELGGKPCAVMRPGSYKQTDDYCSKGGYNPARPFMPGVILWPDRRLFHGAADFRMLLPMIDAMHDDEMDYSVFPNWDKERGKISC